MGYRLLSFIIVFFTVLTAVYTDVFGDSRDLPPALILGFLLLAGSSMGFFMEFAGLPRLTGYILTGLIFGPYVLGLFTIESVYQLNFLNSLALAFIAFCAGGELKLAEIRRNAKTIFYMLGGITLFVFSGVTIAVVFLSSYIPFIAPYPFKTKIAIASIFGIISTARSPSSAIAIINETKAKGEYTNSVLSVTIAMDVIVIILFAVAVTLSRKIITPQSTASFIFIIELIFEIGLAMAIGYFLGKSIIFLVRELKVELPIVVAAMGFLVIKFCHLLGQFMSDLYSISLNLEPLLICMAAGFTVQNLSKYGKEFLESMTRISLPIYVAFFVITGAMINVDVLRESWFLGLAIVTVRLIMVYLGSYLSGRAAGEEPRIYRNTWLGFITQAGVSIGLVTEVVRRFPEFGVQIQSILIASITFNQLLGPAAFKHGLNLAGETGAKYLTR
ncbi:MAG: cation:proton antiporter [bacterium]